MGRGGGKPQKLTRHINIKYKNTKKTKYKSQKS